MYIRTRAGKSIVLDADHFYWQDGAIVIELNEGGTVTFPNKVDVLCIAIGVSDVDQRILDERLEEY